MQWQLRKVDAASRGIVFATLIGDPTIEYLDGGKANETAILLYELSRTLLNLIHSTFRAYDMVPRVKLDRSTSIDRLIESILQW